MPYAMTVKWYATKHLCRMKRLLIIPCYLLLTSAVLFRGQLYCTCVVLLMGTAEMIIDDDDDNTLLAAGFDNSCLT